MKWSALALRRSARPSRPLVQVSRGESGSGARPWSTLMPGMIRRLVRKSTKFWPLSAS